MKKISRMSMLLVTVFLLVAGQAWAESFSFTGSYTITDVGGGSPFQETISLSDGWISVFDPVDDGVFADLGDDGIGGGDPSTWEKVVFPTLILDESSYVSGVRYDFNPTTFTDGFQVYDNGGVTLLFEADLTVDSLVVDGSTGYINPAFSMNLTDITAGGSYVEGTSKIVDTFLTAPGGATNITLQFAGTDLGDKIENGGEIASTYSGSAATVPEPATMLLLGVGLIGLSGITRKKLLKR